MYSSLHPVANALLKKAAECDMKLTHLKLQKLVFFMYAFSLARNGQKLFDENPEPWPYGPVFRSLYHELKSYGSGVIDSYLKDMDIKSKKFVARIPNPDDRQFRDLLDTVWERYGNRSAAQLSSASHEKGGPWDQADKAGLSEIPDDMIMDFYKRQVSNART